MKINFTINTENTDDIDMLGKFVSIIRDSNTKTSKQIMFGNNHNNKNDIMHYCLDIDQTDPNTRYDPDNKLIGTFNSIEEVNQFLNQYKHDNKYTGLKLGQRIQINDGVHNARWYIAGFDCEYNKIASDGTTYDNGTGIMLIPETYLIKNSYDSSEKGYIGSTIHTTTLPTIANNLKRVLGTHLIERNVLLSSSISGDNSNNYTWTKAYATLPSVGQLTGTFASHNNKYDDGEANYKLPLFNYMEYKTGSLFWSRGFYGSNFAWRVRGDGSVGFNYAGFNYGVRPLIYIR